MLPYPKNVIVIAASPGVFLFPFSRGFAADFRIILPQLPVIFGVAKSASILAAIFSPFAFGKRRDW